MVESVERGTHMCRPPYVRIRGKYCGGLTAHISFCIPLIVSMIEMRLTLWCGDLSI